jgi:hypothetical protein
MHSDTFIRKENWLTELISYFNDNENVACVGSGKIELSKRWRNVLKKATDFRSFKRKLLCKPDSIGKFRYYNRTVCSLYRTNILRREKLSFLMGTDIGLTSGKKLYFELVDRGYETVELPDKTMNRYVLHLAHATQVVNPREFSLRKKTIIKCNKLVDKLMASALIQDMLADDSLDR